MKKVFNQSVLLIREQMALKFIELALRVAPMPLKMAIAVGIHMTFKELINEYKEIKSE